MKKLELHLAKLPLGNDVQKFEFNSIDELTHKINNVGFGNNVFLCCVDIANDKPLGTEILISENYVNLMGFIEMIYDRFINSGFLTLSQFKVYFQEYKSYEDAYAVALDIREVNEKCYN